MGIDIYTFIVAVSSLIIASYFYSIISNKTRIPSVLLLLLTGICTRELLILNDNYIPVSGGFIEFFGVVGLILILLDAGLDLNLSRSKLGIIRHAAYSSLLVMLLSIISMSLVFHYWLESSWLASFVFATPLSVISSAVVASSISDLSESKREFLTYESAFSDILGVLLFGYLVSERGFRAASFLSTIGGIIIAVIVSVVVSMLMIWLVNRVKVKTKSFLIFAFLLLVYSLGHIFHLPSLIIVIVFGLIINNWSRIHNYWTDAWASDKEMRETTNSLRVVTIESAFLVRTFFFALFGYTIDVRTIFDSQVLLVGTAVVLIIYAVRYIYLRLFVHAHIIPELFFTPRGLVTVLLFYRIPNDLRADGVDAGVLFFVVIVTTLVLMFGNIFAPQHAIRGASKK